jgi:protease-4
MITYSQSNTAPAPAAPAPRSTTGHWITILVLLLLLGTSALFNLMLFFVAIFSSAGMDMEDSSSKFTEEIIRGRSHRPKVVQIDVQGIISFQKSSGLFFSEQDMATSILQQIDAAEKDKAVIGIFVVVDSPGGGVTASDIIYNRLLTFRDSNKKKRKVVVLMRDLAASGGYYISAAADKIVAHRTTITGSIGVILSAPNFKGLADKIGITDVTIKSGKNKDMLNPLRTPTAEETNILQATVNDMYDRFVSVVARSRNLSEEVVRPIADGRIYTATQALEHKLIDEIGYQKNALELMEKLTGGKKFKLVRYNRAVSLSELLLSRFDHRIELPLPFELSSRTPRMMYLWKPEF